MCNTSIDIIRYFSTVASEDPVVYVEDIWAAYIRIMFTNTFAIYFDCALRKRQFGLVRSVL